MRLIQICDDGSLSLTKDIISDSDVPRYAILSHTWGSDDEEVSFADMTVGTGQGKDGYRKIEFCAEQSRADGLQHFWIDTCCIDKSNHSELSEAINSMFRWYQRAAKCYVCLSDVDRVDDNTTCESETTALESKLEREFRASRWFTRGWTLQELLAPASVEFFGARARWLGSKRSLEAPISEITGIAIDALRGETLSSFTIDERMSWSRGRNTKRPEDRAYSLLGLFGVHMALIYGEGEANAFERLRREIHQHLDWVFERLPIAKGSEFDSYSEEHHRTCQANTRVALLYQLDDWVKAPDSKAVFWLNGMAGTGKSTIARTVASQAAESGRLGASFFFKRGEGDRSGTSKFFSTIAAQLARKEPSFAFQLRLVFERDFNICDGSLQRQFAKLIVDPLSEAFKRHLKEGRIMVVVVDALDECDSEANVKQIITLLSRVNDFLPPSIRLRIFATSRPDIPIRLGFNAVSGTYKDFVLHEVPDWVIQEDLSVYFRCELANIKSEYDRSVTNAHRRLPDVWPSETDLKTLVGMASPLFIFAATICRFLADRRHGNPSKNLEQVLKYRTKSQESSLDATYRPILDMMLFGLSRRGKLEALKEFRDVIGPIVVLAEPLSVSGLATLIDVPQATIDDRLDMFHSVIHVPSGKTSPLRLLHLSFRDFLTDPDKRGEHDFWIDEQATHQRLATSCLRVMNSVLRKNMRTGGLPGGSSWSHKDWTNCDNMELEVITYACQHWAYHLKEGGDGTRRADQVHGFLKKHFLHWLEALAIRGKISRSIEALSALRSILQEGNWPQWSVFLSEATAFVQANIPAMKIKPLQIYSAGLAFAPEGGIIKEMFRRELSKWVPIGPIAKTYGAEGHAKFVTSVSYCPSAYLVASGSTDKTVCLWSAATGVLQHILRGHTGEVISTALSPDARLVASGSSDTSVRIWSTDTGALQQTLQGHSDAVKCVSFSGVEGLVASGSVDGMARLWWVDTGMLHRTLGRHGDAVSCIVFSPVGRLVATGSWDDTIRLWATDSGVLQQTLRGHSQGVSLVAISPDAGLVASSSWDKTLRVWSSKTGHCLSIINANRVGLDLWFDCTGQFLHSHTETFSLDQLPDIYRRKSARFALLAPSTPNSTLRSDSRRGYLRLGLSEDRRWITVNENSMLWLPKEVTAVAISGCTVVVGCRGGAVMIVPFSLSGLHEAGVKESMVLHKLSS